MKSSNMKMLLGEEFPLVAALATIFFNIEY